MSTFTSKYTMICFPCRYTAKAEWMGNKRCPHCGGLLENAGKHFNVPKKSDDKGWRASEAFHREIENRQYFSWPIYRAQKLLEAFKAKRHPR